MSFHSNSKVDLKVRCDYHIKFQLFEGAEDFCRLTAVCCMCAALKDTIAPLVYLVIFQWLIIIIIQTHSCIPGCFDAYGKNYTDGA